jgi:hypothetical protein
MSVDFARILAEMHEKSNHRFSSRDGLRELSRINSTSKLFIVLSLLGVTKESFTPDIAGFMTRQKDREAGKKMNVVAPTIIAGIMLVALWISSRF